MCFVLQFTRKKKNDENRKYSSDKNLYSAKSVKDEITRDTSEFCQSSNIINEDLIVENDDEKYHCLPLVLMSHRKVYVNYDVKRGVTEISVFHFFLLMYLVNYILSIVISPGFIPNTEEWAFKDFQENYLENIESYLLEKKKTGERRYCKWCCKFKPDRTHHCRVCKKCILKMDHHCPWIYNCVGYNNHKYFMLSLIYCCITTLFVSITMFNSVRDAIKHRETPFNELFFLLFGETLNSFLALIITCFLCFHIWLFRRAKKRGVPPLPIVPVSSHAQLMIKAMTTIEFCEKQTNYQNQSYSKYYNKGLYANFKEVFGESPFLWFLPIGNLHHSFSFLYDWLMLSPFSGEHIDGLPHMRGDGINFTKGYRKGYSAKTSEETIPMNANY
ncbi:cell cycle regulator with zn-finger domain [Plasmodium ovale curtisi]|uniref:Palmitoyltransferase n=1 Tax=Plasmodium ovale curtisi TaxID=864141 RepID=A0A1A8VXV1_PLAOA|nr:cell cycle regulator with zn-finger domain [Plasmodium ovale curtisi]